MQVSHGQKKQGFLMKKSASRMKAHPYQRRWFLLKNGVLSVYKNRADVGDQSKMLKAVRLTQTRFKIFDNATMDSPYKLSDYDFVLQFDEDKEMFLRAASMKEKQEWVFSLALVGRKYNERHVSMDQEEKNATTMRFGERNGKPVTASHPSLRIGDIYELGGVLGTGASPKIKVHSARHLKTGEIVAIKSIPKSLLTSMTLRDLRFIIL